MGTQGRLLRPSLHAAPGIAVRNLGGVIYVLAVICTVALAVLAVRDRAWRSLPVAAAAVEVVALVVFLMVVLPVNSRFPVHGSGAVPGGWAGLRDRVRTVHRGLRHAGVGRAAPGPPRTTPGQPSGTQQLATRVGTPCLARRCAEYMPMYR